MFSYPLPSLKSQRYRVKIKNSDWFSSITWGITILLWIFDVSVIIDNHCWRHGRIRVKIKNSDWFSSNTWGIAIGNWILDVSIMDYSDPSGTYSPSRTSKNISAIHFGFEGIRIWDNTDLIGIGLGIGHDSLDIRIMSLRGQGGKHL